MVAILPATVPREELTDAVGINTLQFVFAQMIGPVLAAVMIATAGISWAFALNAVSYLAPIVAMLALWQRGIAGGVPRSRSGGPGSSGRPEVRIGAIAYMRSHPWVAALLLGVIACSAPLEIVRTLSPAIAESLHEPESSAGFLIAAQSIGSAIALLAFVPLRRSGRSRDLARVGLLLQGLGLILTMAAHDLALAAIAGGLLGFGFSLCFPVLTSSLQAEVPDAVRGRIMSAHQMANLGNRPFAALGAGAAAAVVGAQPAVLIGLVLIPLGLVAGGRAWRSLATDHAATAIVPSAADEVA
jgi:hypothetical protein